MTTAEVGPIPLLIVPLGATEQHGPHLPLDTDTRIATAWATAVAREIPSARVAPALSYGSSGEHQSFEGTLSIGQQALQLVVVELVRSAMQSAKRVLLLSGHAGNAAPLRTATAQLRREGHDVHSLIPMLDGSDAHAGRTETSLMLAIDPETVHMDRAVAGNTAALDTVIDTLRRGGVAAVSGNGVLGDPTAATPEEGRQLLAQLVALALDALGHMPSGESDDSTAC